MKRVVIASSILIVTLLSGYAGFILGDYSARGWLHIYASPISAQEGLNYVEAMGATHQYIIDHPELADDERGSVAFHEDYVTRYKQLYDLITLLQEKAG